MLDAGLAQVAHAVWASSEKKKPGGQPWTIQEFQLLRHQVHEQPEATPEEVAAFLKSRVRKP